jgi:secreted Zn-dependent insulinase-like peptidase
VWHLLDTRFSQPGSHLLFRLSSPAAARSAREAALQHLWLKVLEEVLNEDAYLAGGAC